MADWSPLIFLCRPGFLDALFVFFCFLCLFFIHSPYRLKIKEHLIRRKRILRRSENEPVYCTWPRYPSTGAYSNDFLVLDTGEKLIGRQACHGARWWRSKMSDSFFFGISSNLDPGQINGIHHGALKELDRSRVPLQQTFELQVGFFPARKKSQQNTNGRGKQRKKPLRLVLYWFPLSYLFFLMTIEPSVTLLSLAFVFCHTENEWVSRSMPIARSIVEFVC